MNLKEYDIDPADEDDDGLAEAQQPDTGTPFVLNGTYCDSGTPLQFDISDDFAQCAGVKVTFTSTGNWSGVTITVVGKNQDGNAVTEDITGPNNSTVTSTLYYSQILAGGITVDGTVATDITAGTADEVITKTIPVNYRQSHDPFTVAVLGLTGTIQYDIQQTFERMALAVPTNWIDVESNKTADVVSSLTNYATGTRLVVDSYSSGAELQFHVNGD